MTHETGSQEGTMTTLSERQMAAYRIGCEYRGLALHTAWEREIHGADRVNYLAPVAAACFEAGVLGHEPPRWVTGWRYGRVPATGVSRNYRDNCAEAGVSIMQVDGEPNQTDGTYALFCGDGPRIRVAGWLIGRRGSDGEPLIVGAVEVEITEQEG